MGRARPQRSVSRRHTLWWLVAATPLPLIAGGLAWRLHRPTPGVAPGTPVPAGAGLPAMARRETRPPIDPARFVGKARTAHQVARDIPDVLDRLYCYCECDKHLGHRSLLSCYTDGHAAT
jgi:hypothetical protein